MTAADYLSLVRVPLGGLFLLVAGRFWWALSVLVAAGVSDMLDGWVARRQRRADDREHHRGDWLDPLCDKLFVAAVVVGIYLAYRPSPALLVLMVTREILQTVAVAAMRLVPALHRASRDFNFRAHPVGKATTVTQFFTGAALLAELPVAAPLAWLAAGLGVISVGIYISRIRALLPETGEDQRPGVG